MSRYLGKPLASRLWWWAVADRWSHRLRLRLRPVRLRHWICNRFDRAVGLYDDSDWEEMTDEDQDART